MNSANLRLISSEHCLRTKLNKLGTHSSSECTISYSGKGFGTTRIRQTGLAEACAKSNYQDILCICMIISLSLIIGPHLASSLSHCIPNLASPARPNEIDVGDVPEGASTPPTKPPRAATGCKPSPPSWKSMKSINGNCRRSIKMNPNYTLTAINEGP